MESINVLLFVGTFTLCVFPASANECILEGSKCLTMLSAPDMNNIPLFCTSINETLNCINKASAVCRSEEEKEQLKSTKAPFDQQYNMLCGAGSGCSAVTELAKCYPSNFKPEPNIQVNLENCKLLMPMFMCIQAIPQRCPNLKAEVDAMGKSSETEIKACEKLMADSNPNTTKDPSAVDIDSYDSGDKSGGKGGASATQWSGLLWIMAALLTAGGFVYV